MKALAATMLSRDSGETYDIYRFQDGHLECSCWAFRRSGYRRTCKHLNDYLNGSELHSVNTEAVAMD